MILSHEEILKALDSGRLIITPQPSPRYAKVDLPDDYCPFSTHAVDLRLDTEVTIPETGTYAYDLMQKTPLATFIQRNSRRISIDKRDHFVLERHQFILAQTFEDIGLPID